MTDERYVFVQDIKDKKATARGASHKKRGGGRIVRMPSDNLTRKEKARLNSEVKTYELGKPMRWAAYQMMPDDLKLEYFGICHENKVNEAMQARMFGVSQSTVARERHRLGVKGRARKGLPNEEWLHFISPDTYPAPTKDEAPTKDNGCLVSGTLTFNGTWESVNEFLSKAIKGTAVITVSWESKE